MSCRNETSTTSNPTAQTPKFGRLSPYRTKIPVKSGCSISSKIRHLANKFFSKISYLKTKRLNKTRPFDKQCSQK